MYLNIFFVVVLKLIVKTFFRDKDGNFNGVGKEVKGKTHTFYQVLIDQRDCPFIVSV